MSDFDPDAHLDSSINTHAFDPDAHLGHVITSPLSANTEHYSATDGMSNYDLAMAGAGKSIVDMYHGARQILGRPGAQNDADEAARLDKDLMKTGAGMTGYIGGSLASAVLPVGLAGKAAQAAGLTKTGLALTSLANPATYAAGAASGAIQGALNPTETGDSRAINTAVGGALGAGGQLLAKGAGALGGKAVNALGDSANRAVKALSDAGVPLDAAQRTGAILWQRAKAMLSDNPLTAGAQSDFQSMQQKAVNKAFLATTGETANAATPDVMGRLKTRLGNTYDDIADRTNVHYDHVEQPLSDIMNNARLRLNDSQFGTVQRNVDDILNKASQNGGVISGDQFKNVKMTLDKLSGGADSDIGEVARDVRQAMNDGLLKSAQQSGNTADVDLLKKTNQQWRNMRTIEGAIDKQGSGDISPARLSTIMSQKANRAVSIYGQGDTSLSDLAKASNELITNHMPNSGTAARIASLGTLPAIGAGIGAVREGDWQGAAIGAGAGVVLPKIAQKMLNSQGSKTAMNVLGSLSEPSRMSLWPGSVLQHLPLSAVLGSSEQVREK